MLKSIQVVKPKITDNPLNSETARVYLAKIRRLMLLVKFRFYFIMFLTV